MGSDYLGLKMSSMKIAFILDLYWALQELLRVLWEPRAKKRPWTSQLDSMKQLCDFKCITAFSYSSGNIAKQVGKVPLLDWSVYGAIVGTILFSGSIYLLVLTPLKMGIVTPIGGGCTDCQLGMHHDLGLWAV